MLCGCEAAGADKASTAGCGQVIGRVLVGGKWPGSRSLHLTLVTHSCCAADPRHAHDHQGRQHTECGFHLLCRQAQPTGET